MDYWHGGLVTINIISFAECVHDVELDVWESDEGDVDQADELVHPTDIFPHYTDTFPVICHVLAQVTLYFVKISIHVPYLVCTFYNKLGTVKFFWSLPVKSLLFKEATVVIASSDLPIGNQGHQDKAITTAASLNRRDLTGRDQKNSTVR